jgi:hypothetical protein
MLDRRLLPAIAFVLIPGALIAESPCPPVLHTNQRAGWPERVAPWAKPSDTPHDAGYLVGGNKHLHGDPPAAIEGTWGRDYTLCLPRRLALGWAHGRRECSPPGTYRTDGPPCRP